MAKETTVSGKGSGADEQQEPILLNHHPDNDEDKAQIVFFLSETAASAGSHRPDAINDLPALEERETWAKKAEFLLAVIGFAVDLGNVWRFPYICAFLIPYVVMMVFGGLPLFYMELALGQFHRSGCLTLWRRICPALKGVGYAICIIDFYMGMYYNTIIGWAVYYFVASFTSELPWTSCDHPWNTNSCALVGPVDNGTFVRSPAQEYFERNVLENYLSDGLDDIGPIKWSLALCVFAVFILVYFSLWKGVRSTGKAVWITAVAPYIVLIILLIRGASLPGAGDGIRYFLTPQWSKLAETKVWTDAASQVFFSLGPGFGTLLALSSYNKFHNNCFYDALLTSSINLATSLLAGFVIFAVLGYMAEIRNVSIDQLGLEGPGLVFVVYPEAIATMAGSTFWSMIFFFLLITLGLDSTFGGLEAMITGLCDEYPVLLGRRRNYLLEYYSFSSTSALYRPPPIYDSIMEQGGMYLVDLLNVYGPGIAILFLVFVEAMGVSWCYGTQRFSNDIESMLGFQPGPFWKITWAYVSPIFILLIFICTLVDPVPLDTQDYTYPAWSIKVGWVLTAIPLSCIPVYMIYKFGISKGSFTQRLVKMFTPEDTSDPRNLSQISLTARDAVGPSSVGHHSTSYGTQV
ncbi:hypothetical protein GHT06_012136 [Daphnia sinensis]|uniref:Transporter n=1 Tax=Daphnia sinensis TaxID=1820382 RepID=A0AAD5PZK4_9CRUS|nr:hypothetical protein GHT06_012136 [Daphnia sinensis]